MKNQAVLISKSFQGKSSQTIYVRANLLPNSPISPTGCPKNVTEFQIEITLKIFGLENQFDNFGKLKH